MRFSEKVLERRARIFNEWVRQYAEDPGSFSEILDRDGKPIADYGILAAHFFTKIERDLEKAGALPV